MTYLNQIGFLPALLIILGGLLVLRSAGEEKVPRRFLRYLLLVGSGLLLALLGAMLMTPAQDNRPFGQVANVMVPAFIGVLALVGLYGKQLTTAGRGTQLWALLLLLGLTGMLIAYWNIPFELAYRILPGLAVLVLGWAIGHRFRNTTVLLAVLLLLALLGLNLWLNEPSATMSPPPRWLGFIIFPVFYAAPGLIVVVAAVLLTEGLSNTVGKRPWLLIVLALGLLGYLAYSIFWASIWDQTSDGLGGVVLSQPSAVVAVGAGMVMAITLTGWRRGAGILYAILIPLLLYQSFEQGWQVSYHALTEARAERIAQALADYRQREGIYPPTLSALTPRYLLRVPQPVELQGETWCYQGGPDFYRLGAFSREFFSMPVTIQVYAATGEPDMVWACKDQLASMKARYYSPLEDPAAMQPPLPTPLPASEVALAGETLAPLLADNVVWGSWSPDGAYFLLGKGDSAGGVKLSFLNGRSGELCTASGAYFSPPYTVNLRQHHVWLSDEQLLLVDESGQIVLLSPCEPGAQNIIVDSPELFTEIMAQDDANGRILFKSASEFWIFDSRSMAWQLIPGVTPNPYEAHWDNAAWQPDGRLLAISRLNGRDAGDGSTLYIIDGDDGQIIHTIPLAEASDQSAPRVDWLSPQELMLGGSGLLRILDFSADPPLSTDVMADIFGLDLDFPDEVWGNGWQVDWENGRYSLTVQANHPRNQALYHYESATGTTDVYDEENNLLLRFPNGQIEQWTKPEWESEPVAADEFVLIDVAEGKVYPSLTISGHTPRDYSRLSMAYLAETEQLAVASSQGISLHTLPDGQMTGFWTLTGQGFAPFLQPAPDGSALVAVRDLGGVYWLPLP